MVYQKVVKSRYQKFSFHSFERSSNTSLSDHCNHIKFAESMPIEILASELLVVMGTYSSKLRSFLCCARISEQNVGCTLLRFLNPKTYDFLRFFAARVFLNAGSRN